MFTAKVTNARRTEPNQADWQITFYDDATGHAVLKQAYDNRTKANMKTAVRAQLQLLKTAATDLDLALEIGSVVENI